MNRSILKTLVPSQLPDYVRAEFPIFIEFVQAYYEYLSQSGVVIDFESIRDLDKSVLDFIEHIKTEIAPKIPFNVADNRFKTQRIKDLYESKGSAASYKLLFRMLYGVETDIFYPSTQMLIPSDGRWVQPYSIFVKLQAESTFNPPSLVGKLVKIVSDGKVIEVFVEQVDAVYVLDANGLVLLDNTVFQLFINKNYYGKINTGSDVVYLETGSVFSAKIVPAVTKVSVNIPGKNFKAGEIYNISTFTGYGARLKINKVGPIGEIISAELISSGVNYSSNFSLTLFSKKDSTGALTSSTTTSLAGNQYTVTIPDSTDPLVDYGNVLLYDYTIVTDYWDNGYVGSIVTSFYDTSQFLSVDSTVGAVVSIESGPVMKYPGYFSSNAGFLSDSLFIQDSKYYQTFSYVVKLNRTLDDYGGVLKTLLHPAGTALFGEFNLNDEIEMGVEITDVIFSTKVNYLILNDTASPIDSISSLT